MINFAHIIMIIDCYYWKYEYKLRSIMNFAWDYGVPMQMLTT